MTLLDTAGARPVAGGLGKSLKRLERALVEHGWAEEAVAVINEEGSVYIVVLCEHGFSSSHAETGFEYGDFTGRAKYADRVTESVVSGEGDGRVPPPPRECAECSGLEQA